MSVNSLPNDKTAESLYDTSTRFSQRLGRNFFSQSAAMFYKFSSSSDRKSNHEGTINTANQTKKNTI